MLKPGMVVRIRNGESRAPRTENRVVRLTEPCGPSGRIWYGEVLPGKDAPDTKSPPETGRLIVLAQSQVVAVQRKGAFQVVLQGMFGG